MENLCVCGKLKSLVKNCKNVFKKTCGDKDCIIASRKKTTLTLYGVEHARQSNEINNKMKKKLISKYGVDNVSKLKIIKDKKKETCFKNFGVEHPMQSKIVMGKSKLKLLQLYGVDNISKLEETINKIQETKNTVRPESGKTILEEAQDKRKDYYLTKYGKEFLFQTDIFKKEYKKIMLKKYGVDNYSKTKLFKDEMISRGLFKSDEDVKNFNNYSRLVRLATERTFNENFDLLTKEYVRGEDYHLDHIFSIFDGFKYSIKPEIIASVVNLQLIPAIINKLKNRKSWITESELIKRYNRLI